MVDSTAAQQPQAPSKSKEQLQAEKLSEIMEVIRRDLLHYVDASLVAVEPLQVDDAPSWAPDQMYNMEVVTTDANMMPFPQGVLNSVGHLLAAPQKEPTLPLESEASFERAVQCLLTVVEG
eukprot:CAMPEP_0176440344 /NCGR_PEP_ID=MMETSP0127-20121128/20510_1 /TAXON_ID=938130 /ORGANISM="Platyophrya macrostoma, Strain WH" /LENGTH=120 /DNA_ID=CAMNT_0017824841 /DNA_START=465 /DNA_END=827 /DNA_ORIENTATION=-